MMKKSIIFVSLGMFVISSIALVGCSKDEELDAFYSLDISSRIPITRSAQADWETGSSQTIGGTSTSLYTIPQNENECMLYALISIASSKHIPITFITPDGQGGYSQTTKTIGKSGFSAEEAYRYVKELATGRSWIPCDVFGNPMTDGNPYNYEGGAMAPSVAKTIGQQSGILQGETMYFKTFDELHSYMNTPEFKINHPKGTYIISSESGAHATVGMGVDSNGNVRYTDADHNFSTKYKDSEKNGSWTLIF